MRHKGPEFPALFTIRHFVPFRGLVLTPNRAHLRAGFLPCGGCGGGTGSSETIPANRSSSFSFSLLCAEESDVEFVSAGFSACCFCFCSSENAFNASCCSGERVASTCCFCCLWISFSRACICSSLRESSLRAARTFCVVSL